MALQATKTHCLTTGLLQHFEFHKKHVLTPERRFSSSRIIGCANLVLHMYINAINLTENKNGPLN